MLVDANILLYAVDDQAPLHGVAKSWLTVQLNGNSRVGLPWESLSAFLRIASNPRASDRPLTSESAWKFVRDWLAQPVVWNPLPTERHAEVLGGLVERHGLTGNLVSDGRIASLAIEHGLVVYSADTDFARFSEIRWENPLAP